MNKRFMRMLEPRFRLCFIMLVLFALSSFFISPWLAAGELAAMDPDALAMMYASPVLTLIGICDRQPEREGECLEKLQNHVRLFFRMVHTEEA